MSDMLFDVRPIEDEDGRRKKPASRRKKRDQPSATAAAGEWRPDGKFTYGYMASIDGHLRCDRCDLSIVDLVEIRRVGAKEEWVVKCGWGCHQEWIVEPVDGVLDKPAPAFRVKGGRFDGQTFDEIAASGCRWYMESVVEVGTRSTLVDAAREWLQKNA